MPFHERIFDEPTDNIQTRMPQSLCNAIVDVADLIGINKSRMAYSIFTLGWATFSQAVESGRITEAVEKLENDLKPRYKKKLLEAFEKLQEIGMDEIRDKHKLERFDDPTRTA
jgi:hypothetical protein